MKVDIPLKTKKPNVYTLGTRMVNPNSNTGRGILPFTSHGYPSKGHEPISSPLLRAKADWIL